MMYARVENGKILSVGGHPGWMDDAGPLSDGALAAEGYMPVVQDAVTGADDLLNILTWNDYSEWRIEPGRVVQTYTLSAHPLLLVQSRAATQIDALADQARAAFVTQGGPGQALEYEQTRREIEAWKSAASPIIDHYPMLAAEYRARLVADPDVGPSQVVNDAVSEMGIWYAVGPAIKEIRRTGKVAVEVALTPERVREIVDWCGRALAQATSVGAFDPLQI